MSLDWKGLKQSFFWGFVLLCAPVFAAFSFEVTQTGISLAPMEKPVERQVGDRWVQLKNGAETIETELVSETYATHTFRNTDDCIVTRRKGTRFTPYVSWICPSGNGTNTVTKNGNPWPLEVGKEWSYDVNGKDGDGAQWSYELECEVEDTAIVESRLGVYNTYRVLCTHKWGTQTIYMAPSLGEQVYFLSQEGENVVTYEVTEMEKGNAEN